MKSNRPTTGTGPEFGRPPFLYEIRVKGRLSSEQWMSWFDDLTVSTAKGESTLRGKVPDHAALYGLIARLRDLAVPLVAVKVLDAEAQLRLSRQSRRYDLMINLLLVAIYLALLGGLSTITIFVAPIINVALALALLFALLGGLAHAFWLWSGQAAWRWITYGTWPAAAITFLVFLPVSGVLPPALGIAIILLLAAGGLIYLVSYLRRRAEKIHSSFALEEFSAGAAGSIDRNQAAETAQDDTTSNGPRP
jgi:hypothetical protein